MRQQHGLVNFMDKLRYQIVPQAAEVRRGRNCPLSHSNAPESDSLVSPMEVAADVFSAVRPVWDTARHRGTCFELFAFDMALGPPPRNLR